MLQQAAVEGRVVSEAVILPPVLFEIKRKMYYTIIDKSIEFDPNGAYLSRNRNK